MADGPLLPCVPSPPTAPSLGACRAPVPELARHRAGVGGQRHGSSPSQTPKGARTSRAAQVCVAALEASSGYSSAALEESKLHRLAVVTAELPHKPRGGGEDYEPCGLVTRRSHADSICNKRKLAPKTAAVSREWSLLPQAVPSNLAPEGLRLQTLIRICSPCSVSEVTPPSSPAKSPSLVTPAHALPERVPEFKIKFHFLHVLSVRKDQGHPCTAALVHKCIWLTGANIRTPAISPPSAELWLQVLGTANDPFSSKCVWHKAGKCCRAFPALGCWSHSSSHGRSCQKASSFRSYPVIPELYKSLSCCAFTTDAAAFSLRD